MDTILHTLHHRYVVGDGRLEFGRLSVHEERDLAREHERHFTRRARVLDPSFFPGRERTKEGVRSASNGAYASFRREPSYDGVPAFIHSVAEFGETPKQFLYYWRHSATLDFLKANGSEDLRNRLNLLRSLSAHLRQAFFVVGERLGEQLWWLRAEAPRSTRDGFDVGRLLVDTRGLRGKAEIARILEAAGVPLSRSELAAALQRLRHERPEPEIPSDGLDPATPAEAETRLLERDLEERVRDFFRGLSEDERCVLRRRGHGEQRDRLRPFAEVADGFERRGEESCRLLERQVLQALGDHFGREEGGPALRLLGALIRGDES